MRAIGNMSYIIDVMEIIQTSSFKLAVNTKGDKNAEKVAILLPGRLDTKDYANFVSHQEYLASKGFYAVALDPPGTWESPGGIELFTTTNYLKAVNELIEYYGNRPTLLLGHSRGAEVAALVSTANPLVIGLVSINGSFGPPSPQDEDLVKDGMIIEPRDLLPGTIKTAKQKIFKLPVKYFEDGNRYDSVAGLRNWTKPKLVFYSTKDEWREPEEVIEIFESLAEPKMIYELNSTHDYRYFSKVVEQVNLVVGQFIDNNAELS